MNAAGHSGPDSAGPETSAVVPATMSRTYSSTGRACAGPRAAAREEGVAPVGREPAPVAGVVAAEAEDAAAFAGELGDHPAGRRRPARQEVEPLRAFGAGDVIEVRRRRFGRLRQHRDHARAVRRAFEELPRALGRRVDQPFVGAARR